MYILVLLFKTTQPNLYPFCLLHFHGHDQLFLGLLEGRVLHRFLLLLEVQDHAQAHPRGQFSALGQSSRLNYGIEGS